MEYGKNGLPIIEVGKSVKYFPGDNNDDDVKLNGNDKGPVAAIVTRVWGDDGLVNLTVFPDMGDPVFKGSVHHEQERWAGNGYYIP